MFKPSDLGVTVLAFLAVALTALLILLPAVVYKNFATSTTRTQPIERKLLR